MHKLSPYETYALLVAILLHDAGNAAGRMGHERKAFAILSKMPDVCIDSTERRTISRIAQAHGGRTASGDKDTIRLVIAEDPADVQGTPVRPRLLAAVLRMADEISEGPTRANVVALKKPYAQPEAVIHNLYCKVVSIGFDLRARQLTLTYDFDAAHLEEAFADEGGQIGIIDYIAGRVAKCDSERQYCNRYFAPLLVIERMIVRLGVTCDDGEVTLFQKTFVFEDEGYPAANIKIRADLPSNAAVLAHCRAGRASAEASV